MDLLSDAYHDQQLLVQKSFDDRVKQKLTEIEQQTKKNTEKQLRLLHEKHAKTIESYLDYCIELHRGVPLTGIEGNVAAKVACHFYEISPEDRNKLERSWRANDLPLTRTFIQLRPDKSTAFERNESRRLLMEPDTRVALDEHSRKEASKGIWQRLVSAPYMLSMVERDRYVVGEGEENVNEENILRTKRWIVVLGDPGSGKTSFVRWLVAHLAQRLRINGQHSTDFGPLRIPILIRIGEFVDALNRQSSLTLFDYIGQHKWMGKALVDESHISLNCLSNALNDYIKQGQALIILDGLDEIPVSEQRSKITNLVENFVENYVQTSTGISVFDNPHMNRLFDDPFRSGGNQLIVTSRIVGYHAAPLDDVGILAARGESLYGFLHLTFQEYFTCLKLIDVDKLKQEKMATHSLCSEGKVQLVVQSLRRHMNNPRFRVPIALALEQDLSNSLLPLGAYIFIISANDLVNYPSDNVLFDALDQLMIAAGQYQWIFTWKRN
ncbi:unnamed protein product [Rotaria sordida]|uniref:NACHT domain-containing protein n=1 Tax=Rotaria sordida TaxID=392033 RepID=A0A819IHF1_9BILA|nr:unnamed protein product [Rotaria sordida]